MKRLLKTLFLMFTCIALSIPLVLIFAQFQKIYLCGSDISCKTWEANSIVIAFGLLSWFLIACLFTLIRKPSTEAERKESRSVRSFLPIIILGFIIGSYIILNIYVKTDNYGISYNYSFNPTSSNFIKWEEIKAIGYQLLPGKNHSCGTSADVLVLRDNSLRSLMDSDPNLVQYLTKVRRIPFAGAVVGCNEKI